MTSEKLFNVRGKVVVVTGGSRGIGLMIAQGFVDNGAKVYIVSRNEKACKQVSQQLSTKGFCEYYCANLTNSTEVNSFVNFISEKENALDILVNNSGANWGAGIDEYPEAAFDKVFSLNVKGVFLLTQKLLPLLRKAATKECPARIINIGSVDGIRVPHLETYAYSASKAALHHLTRVLAFRLAMDNITVNAVAPGPFPSKMMKATLERFEEEITNSIPLKRVGEPDDMVGICIFLSSRAGRYVTGECIAVDGGALVAAKL